MVETGIAYEDVEEAGREYDAARAANPRESSWSDPLPQPEVTAAGHAYWRLTKLYAEEVAWWVELALRRHAGDLDGMRCWYKGTRDALLGIATDAVGDMPGISLSANSWGGEATVVASVATGHGYVCESESEASVTPPSRLMDAGDAPRSRDWMDCRTIAYPDPLPEMRPRPAWTAADVRDAIAREGDVRAEAGRLAREAAEELQAVALRYARLYQDTTAGDAAMTGVSYGDGLRRWVVSANPDSGRAYADAPR